MVFTLYIALCCGFRFLDSTSVHTRVSKFGRSPVYIQYSIPQGRALALARGLIRARPCRARHGHKKCFMKRHFKKAYYLASENCSDQSQFSKLKPLLHCARSASVRKHLQQLAFVKPKACACITDNPVPCARPGGTLHSEATDDRPNSLF